MNRRQKQVIEIETLHELLPALNYYQLLGLQEGTDQAEIDPAYRAEARRLHPDRYATVGGPELKAQVNNIYRAVNEAYRVLRDPDARAAYDDELANGGRRMSEDARKEAEAAAAAANNPELAARTEKGAKYWKMALQNWETKNYKGCIQMIQFAQMYEKDNEVFDEWMEKAKQAQLEAENTGEHNPYKLRIV
jgi:curved DNA-binding protein CbpA